MRYFSVVSTSRETADFSFFFFFKKKKKQKGFLVFGF